MTKKSSEIKTFLTALYGTKPEAPLIQIWDLRKKRTACFKTIDGQHGAFFYAEAKKREDIYVGCGLSRKKLPPNKRCKARDIAGIPGFYADIDILDPEAHTKENLPPTIEDAEALCEEIGLLPTLIVHTGHGIHAWWLFREIWIFGDDDERARAADLEERLIRRLQGAAKEKGWTVDSVFDLSRVLRIPGTMNCKNKQHKVPVKLLKITDRRYKPENFEKTLPQLSGDSTGIQLDLKKSSSKTTASEPPHYGQIDRSGQVDPTRLEALLALNPKTRAIWEKMPGALQSTDQSPSSWDMSLSNYAAMAGWSPSEIVALLLTFRAKHGHDLKPGNDQYYMRTVLAALQAADSPGAPPVDNEPGLLASVDSKIAALDKAFSEELQKLSTAEGDLDRAAEKIKAERAKLSPKATVGLAKLDARQEKLDAKRRKLQEQKAKIEAKHIKRRAAAEKAAQAAAGKMTAKAKNERHRKLLQQIVTAAKSAPADFFDPQIAPVELLKNALLNDFSVKTILQATQELYRGFKLLRIEQYRQDPPFFKGFFIDPKGELQPVIFGHPISNFTQFGRHRDIFYSATRKIIPRVSPGVWDEQLEALGTLCVTPPVPEETTRTGRLVEMLRDYIGETVFEWKPEHSSKESIDYNWLERRAFFDTNRGRWVLFAESFFRWSECVFEGYKFPSFNECINILRDAGCKGGQSSRRIPDRATLISKPVNRRFYVVPNTILPQPKNFKDRPCLVNVAP